MSSTLIFRSLRELFPQVDLRILRAVSIEHEKDINEAVEFILSDVLPAANIRPRLLEILDDTSCLEQELNKRANDPEPITIPDDEPVSPITPLNNGAAKIKGGENKPEGTIIIGHEPAALQFIGTMEIGGENSRTEIVHEASSYTDSLSFNLNHLIEKDNESLSYKGHIQKDHFESLLDKQNEKIILADHSKFSVELECADIVLHANDKDVLQVTDEKIISSQLVEQNVLSAAYDNSFEYEFEKENCINIPLNVINDLSGCSNDACISLKLLDVEHEVHTPDVGVCLPSLLGVSDKDQIHQDFINETYEDALCQETHGSIISDANSLELSLPLTSLATRSGHLVSTDLLEESIEDAKNSKKSLVSSLESMVSTMREVELLEGKVKQAKEEALVAGSHILSEVEELQMIVKQSKDENDKQSGHVYGERSILATEARELQSRLLRMSKEKSKYLLIIEEISKALEVREAAAKDDLAAANLEKLEKEELAKKSLNEHELMRNAAVAESQKLAQEAEQNSRLREFLMDRGRVVDSLQGEIAIICEDILSLKQRADVSASPLSKTLMQSPAGDSFDVHIIRAMDDWEFCEN